MAKTKTANKIVKKNVTPKIDSITNIIITGVGGQGVLSLAITLANVAMENGYEVRMSELHGLAQRFGHLECHIRFGKNVRTSIIPNGDADLVIALEPLESLVMYKYMDVDRTHVLMDTNVIKPTRMDIERTKYPEIKAIVKSLKTTAKNVDAVNATDIVKKAVGSSVYANIYLLGIAMKKKWIVLDKKKISDGLKMLPSPEINERVFKLALK